MAASSTPINGTAYYVEVSADSGTTWNKLGDLTNCSLTRGMDTRETTDKNSSGNSEFEAGKKNWSLSGEGNLTYATESGFVKENDLEGYWDARTKLDIRFSTANAGDYQNSGVGFITQFDLTAPTEDNMTYSINFQGSGSLTSAAVS